jgi:hypothetical protein
MRPQGVGRRQGPPLNSPVVLCVHTRPTGLKATAGGTERRAGAWGR